MFIAFLLIHGLISALILDIAYKTGYIAGAKDVENYYKEQNEPAQKTNR